MKNRYYILLMVTIGLVISGFNSAETEKFEANISYEVPENINVIIDKSCFMCHNADSKNKKAKMKFKLDKMSSMKVSKQISKLSKIAKEVDKGDMPPAKFLEHNPDKALSQEEKDTLIKWAKDYAKELAK
jgi:predicted transcriptional regulator